MYKLQENGVKRLSDSASIPESEGNYDWQKYLKWVSIEGNTPEPQYSLQELITNKANEFDSECAKELISGINITVLNTVAVNRFYSTSKEAQMNIQALVIAGIGANYQYMDLDTDTKMYIWHTPEEIMDLFQQGMQFKDTVFARLDDKLSELDEATIENIDQLVW